MKKYLTLAGDRWDWISYKFYGTPFYARKIIEANPQVSPLLFLPAGIELLIPDISPPEPEIKVVPPWKSED